MLRFPRHVIMRCDIVAGQADGDHYPPSNHKTVSSMAEAILH